MSNNDIPIARDVSGEIDPDNLDNIRVEPLEEPLEPDADAEPPVDKQENRSQGETKKEGETKQNKGGKRKIS